MEDGRLTGAGRESFEAHAAHCRDCSKEAAWLQELREMRSFEVVEPSPMQRRRLRATILRKANNRIVRSAGLGVKGWVAGAASALVVVGAVVARTSMEKKAAMTNLAPAASAELNEAAFEVTPIERADWNVVRKGPRAEVALTEGALSIHVQKLRDGQRFIVTLPDGELEVRGTRFEVAVHHHATARVRVTEGVVDLRVAGFSERTLVAGEIWTQPIESTQAMPAPHAEEADPATATLVSPHAEAREPASETGEPVAVHPKLRTVAKPSKRVVRDEPGARIDDGGAGAAFQEAMSAFNAGAYADAEQKLTRFEHDFPSDARSEDASFLRIVCASRRGDRSAVVVRARSYLAAHSNGLRRAAVEELLRGQQATAEPIPAR